MLGVDTAAGKIRESSSAEVLTRHRQLALGIVAVAGPAVRGHVASGVIAESAQPVVVKCHHAQWLSRAPGDRAVGEIAPGVHGEVFAPVRAADSSVPTL